MCFLIFGAEFNYSVSSVSKIKKVNVIFGGGGIGRVIFCSLDHMILIFPKSICKLVRTKLYRLREFILVETNFPSKPWKSVGEFLSTKFIFSP